jgi:aminoglycoside phosphotransferase (APT) family kinase protein
MEEKGLDPKEVGKRLQAWFEEKVPRVSKVNIKNLIRRAEGFSAEIFTFSAAWIEDGESLSQELVLRLDPGRKSAEYMQSTLERQFKTLKCIESANIDVPAPKVYWVEEDQSYLDGPFLIMSKLDGEPYLPWSPEGRNFLENIAGKADAPRQAVEILTRMHRMDWEKYGLSFLGVPENEYAHAESHIKICEDFMANAWQPEPLFVEAICWLKENKPKMKRMVFNHGDYRTGNMLWEETKITGLTDWELCHIGDPHFDLGTFCSKTHRMDSPLMNYLVDRQFLYECYEELTGWEVDPKALYFWETYFCLIDGIFWMSSFSQFLRGKTDDLRRARGFISYLHNKQLIAEYLEI